MLKHQDLGCPGLGSFLLIPSTPKMGLLVPIIGSTSYSNSIIVDLKIYGALEDKIGYAELSPLKGLLLPIYIERHFFSSTYQEHCAQTEPYFQQLKDKIKSLEISLEHCWQLPETANSPG
ncbi:MAG TPA: hypothetical protein P5280_06885 [Cyclobacteriaceae bacterium]|nr:hypothetical protein [Cyclobacteriaceae bacterium]